MTTPTSPFPRHRAINASPLPLAFSSPRSQALKSLIHRNDTFASFFPLFCTLKHIPLEQSNFMVDSSVIYTMHLSTHLYPLSICHSVCPCECLVYPRTLREELFIYSTPKGINRDKVLRNEAIVIIHLLARKRRVGTARTNHSKTGVSSISISRSRVPVDPQPDPTKTNWKVLTNADRTLNCILSAHV